MNPNPKRIIPVIIGVVILLIMLSKSTITIGSGEGGVLFKPFGGGWSLINLLWERGFI